MPRRPSTFSQDDIERALRGAERAGTKVRRLVIIGPNGKLVLVIAEGSEPDDAASDAKAPAAGDIVL